MYFVHSLSRSYAVLKKEKTCTFRPFFRCSLVAGKNPFFSLAYTMLPLYSQSGTLFDYWGTSQSVTELKRINSSIVFSHETKGDTS